MAAFETRAVAATGTGLHTLVTTTRSLTVTGTATAAEDLVTVSGALNGGQRMELHSWEIRLSAERLDLFERAELGETIKGRLHDGLRVIRTHGLREDVLEADHFEDSTDAAAGDEAGTR